MRYLIMGTGALGTVFGGLLQRAGHAVAFLGRGAHFQRLITAGGFIDGIWGEHPLAPVTQPHPGDLYDVIFLTVKSFDTATALRQAVNLAAPDGLVVSLQNGLGNIEIIARECGVRRTIGGRVIFGAQVAEPGRVTVTVYADPVLLGAIDPGAPAARLDLVSQHLNDGGIPTRIVPDIIPQVWGKALYNCALNPLGAVLGVPYGALGDHPDTRDLMRHIIEEIYQVAKAKGIRLPLSQPDDYFRHFLENLVPPTAAHWPSMWQDLQAGRPTEIEALNGAICRYGREWEIPTPYNDALTRLVRFRQSHPAG